MNMLAIPSRGQQAMTDLDLCAWVGQAMPGDRLEYHRGFLGIDVDRTTSRLPRQDHVRLVALARAAFGASEAGLVHLAQLRLGPDRFAYLAVARPRPRHCAVPLSAGRADREATR